MKKFALILVLLSITYAIHSQTFSGMVSDDRTGQPIEGVSVFFDGTSIFAVTDAEGRFSITSPRTINTAIVFAHLGYKTVSFDYPYPPLSSVALRERENVISEIVVYAEFSREDMMTAFKENFLGITPAGKSCSILNEEAVRLWFEPENNRLIAAADEPIVIDNHYLGYRILYALTHFYVEFHRHTLDYRAMAECSLSGKALFQDVTEGNVRKMNKRRNTVYNDSRNSFLYELLYGKAADGGKVKFSTENFDRSHSIGIQPMDGIFRIRLDDLPPSPTKVLEYYPTAKGYIEIRNGRRRSGVIFLSDELLMDPYGNVSSLEMVTVGHLANQRLGNILPRDFLPTVQP